MTLSVALIAGAMLLVEIFVTRIFSVLFFYHYSFFAISLIMSGLAFGGLIASRWDVRGMPVEAFYRCLATCANLFSGGVLAATVMTVAFALRAPGAQTNFLSVAIQATCFLPGLIAAGAFLAVAFARRADWINRLYAYDLVAAALACLFSIFLMRLIPGVSTLLVPAGLAAGAGLVVRPPSPRLRLISRFLCFCAVGALVFNAASGWRLAKLSTHLGYPTFERWNEHSRILAMETPEGEKVIRQLLIDKSAAALLPEVASRPKGAPLPVEPWWGEGEWRLAYRLGRPVNLAAVIGVGGGLDVIGALAHGAQHVDGYELNKVIVDYLTEELPPEKSMAHWPEVTLIHNEARVGIAHSGKKYDVIQASMIDTWAATASGGFVLSENGLYTLEGWRIFLSALSDQGVLTMTRWYLQQAETYRMTALAIESLREIGIEDPSQHIIIAGPDFRAAATIIVSKIPFSESEIAHVARICTNEKLKLLYLPGGETLEPTLRNLMDPETRQMTLEDSPFDLSVPTDLRPYFFLLLKPLDVFTKEFKRDDGVHEVTMNGIRVLVILSVIAVLFAAVVFALGMLLSSPSDTVQQSPKLRRGLSLYFLSIGLGYILVQLGLHQRLTLILGHPTLSLSVVLFSMLLGTGLGSASSGRLFPDGTFVRAWFAILAAILCVFACFPLFPLLDRVDSSAIRIILAGLLVAGTGFALGFGFPLGVRLAAPAGESAVQRMWAVNGAASIAGSALAAIIAVSISSRANIVAGLIMYAIAMQAGRSAEVIVRARGALDKKSKS